MYIIRSVKICRGLCYKFHSKTCCFNYYQVPHVHITGILTGCRKKVKIVCDFEGKLCGTKSWLCRILLQYRIAQFCAKQNIWSPTPYQSKHWILFLIPFLLSQHCQNPPVMVNLLLDFTSAVFHLIFSIKCRIYYF